MLLIESVFDSFHNLKLTHCALNEAEKMKCRSLKMNLKRQLPLLLHFSYTFVGTYFSYYWKAEESHRCTKISCRIAAMGLQAPTILRNRNGCARLQNGTTLGDIRFSGAKSSENDKKLLKVSSRLACCS